MQASLISLHFPLLHFSDTMVFTNWRLLATLCGASILAPFFPIPCARFVSLCQHFLAIKYFLIHLCNCFFKYNAIINLIKHTIKSFICIWKPKILYDSLYCDTSFLMVVWNQTCNISVVCLYILIQALNNIIMNLCSWIKCYFSFFKVFKLKEYYEYALQLTKTLTKKKQTQVSPTLSVSSYSTAVIFK